jgi:hypothetical protein
MILRGYQKPSINLVLPKTEEFKNGDKQEFTISKDDYKHLSDEELEFVNKKTFKVLYTKKRFTQTPTSSGFTKTVILVDEIADATGRSSSESYESFKL